MWFDILKQSRLKVSPKTFTTFKIPPKEEQEEGDCNRKLKEYAEQLKNRAFELKTTNDDLQNKGYYINEYVGPAQKSKTYSIGKVIGEEMHFFKYETVPEDIACKFLDYIGKSFMSHTVDFPDGYVANRWTRQRKHYRDMIFRLCIGPQGSFCPIQLGIRLNEFSHFPDDNNLQDMDIDWR